MAKKASQNLWSLPSLEKQLKELSALSAEFDVSKTDKLLLRRRAEVLVPALDRLWREFRKSGGASVADFEARIQDLHLLAMDHDDFDPSKFSNALGGLRVTLASLEGASSPKAPVQPK
jgi:hypothetical protein